MNARFISNDPNGEDLFQGKSQDRIAASISNLIINEPGNAKLIGLEGAWGSGKSNVIKIIERKLISTHHLYIHDAWGHQEDLQRRAFLEELTEDLYTKNILDGGKWRKKLSDLLARKEETVTTTVPRLSTGIVVTILLAFITPMTTTIAKEVDEQWGKYLVLSAPLILALLFWAIKSIRRKQPLMLSELFYIYKQKELQNHTQTVTSEEEPSAMQFKRWMRELSDDLGADLKKIIIVFDNMDRLPPEKVQMLWSSINTFFSDDFFENISVLIPFDREHIKDAFNKDALVATQFISKTFPVIFRIAQPVLSDWQGFFKIKFIEAFEEDNEREVLIVRTIFDFSQSVITPRGIIAFINELVSLALTVDEDIPIRYLALFCQNKQAIQDDPVPQILTLQFMERYESIFSSDDNVQDSIAAIFYNVPKDSASQIVVVREVEKALRDANDKLFISLASHKHFLEIVERMSVLNDTPLDTFVMLLAKIEPGTLATEKEKLQNVWTRLNNRYLTVISPISEFSQTNRVLLDKCSEDDQMIHLQKFITVLTQSENVTGKDYATALLALEAHLQTSRISFDIFSPLQPKSLMPEQYIAFLEIVKKHRPELKVKTEEGALNLYLVAEIDEARPVSSVISIVLNEYSFEVAIQHLFSMIKSGTQRMTKANLPPVYQLLNDLAADKPYPQLPDITIYEMMPSAVAATPLYYLLVAARLARGSKYAYAGLGNEEYLERSEGAQSLFIEQITKRFEMFNSYNDLLHFAPAWTQQLAIAVAGRLTKRSYGKSKLNIVSILKNYQAIFESLGLKHSVILSRIASWSSYAKSDVKPANITKVINWPVFYDQAISIKNELTRHLIKTYVEYLKIKELKSWQNSLINQDDEYVNTIRFFKSEHLKSLPTNAVEAFKTILLSFADGSSPLDDQENLMLLYDATSKTKLKMTIKNIRDLFINQLNIQEGQFNFFLPILLELGDLSERASDVVRTILLPVINYPTCLENMIVHSDKLGLVITAAINDGSIFIEELDQLKTTIPKAREVRKKLLPFVVAAKKKSNKKN